jgi:hypothetical protein
MVKYVRILAFFWKMRIAKIVKILVCSNLPTISNEGWVILKFIVE